MSDYFSDLFRATSHGLVLPRDDEDAINRYVAMHASNRENVESRPFPRKVDFWAFCIATALALKLEPRDGVPSRWGQKFIDTPQGVLDNDVCSLLAVVAVAKLGLDDPRGNGEHPDRRAGKPPSGRRLPRGAAKARE